VKSHIPETSFTPNKLFAQGAITELEEDILRLAFRMCVPLPIKKKCSVRSIDFWREDFIYLAQSTTEFRKFYISELQNESHALPGGWWFDGQVYLDLQGNRRETHPSISLIAEKFAELKNNESCKYNELLSEVSDWIN